jgi:hypothetical protein
VKRSNLIRIPLNDLQTRYKLHYESDPCEPNSVAGRNTQMDMLQALANQPQLCYCGPLLFDVLKVHHNGTFWVVEMEAVETRQ